MDGQVEVVIRDTGPGIAHDKRLSVFEPFYSDWENTKFRPGMGLTIALEIVRQHAGEIFIDSSIPSGCAIHVCLPVNNTTLAGEVSG
jgi:signal transduction histidine kinase